MGDRSVGRELAFKAIFQLAFEGNTIDKVMAGMVEESSSREQAMAFARELAIGCGDHLSDIDAAIAEQSKNWDLKRLGSCDRAAIRLGTYELLFRDDIPAEVSINEAVELAKKYGDDASPKFVNGILDGIKKHLAKT